MMNWHVACPQLDLVKSYNDSRNSERETSKLLHFKDVVRIQIGTEPHENNDGKYYKARTVFYWRKKGQQKKPESGIKCPKCHPGEWVIEPLFD